MIEINDTRKAVGKRIAEIRKSKGLNQEELAGLIGGATVQMISGWEKGHSFPSVPYLIILAKKLDTSLDYLLLGVETNTGRIIPKTYKDVYESVLCLLSSDLFNSREYWDGNEGIFRVILEAENKKLSSFWTDFIVLRDAAKTLRKEFYDQSIDDLINKYDGPLKKKAEL